MLVTYGSPFQYVVFGPLGHPLAPSLESMTPEQYVHTMAFREQGFSSDRMPQYRDHTEANQDTGEAVEAEDGASLSSTLTTDSDTAGGVARTELLATPSQPDIADFWESKHFADCKIICAGGEEVLTHRLILAAHNEYFYQLLVAAASADTDTAVIMMPDHSRRDVVAMVQQLYNLKVKSVSI